jgi:putative chitinase
MTVAFTEAELRAFSPNMAQGYRDALLSGMDTMAQYGILKNGRRLTHFFAQFGGETNGGQILRESLTYTTVGAIRKAWKARASKHSDDWIEAHLLRQPVALGDWAYGGRMGNRKGTSDGYDYRGGGFLQTTGRSAVDEYCRKCGIAIRPDILDDFDATLKFAYANDIMGISKAINTGSASSKIVPNGMGNRHRWFAVASEIWWDAEETEMPEETDEPEVVDPPSVPEAKKERSAKESKTNVLDWLAEQGSRIAKVIETARRIFVGLTIGTGAVAAGVTGAKQAGVKNGTVDAAGSVASDYHLVLLYVVIGLLVASLGGLIYVCRHFVFTAAKDGRYSPRGGKPKVA